MRYFTLDSATRRLLVEALSLRYRLFAPGVDVTMRPCWQPTADWPVSTSSATVPAVKRFLLPPEETVWSESPVRVIDQPVALLGVPVCDLAAVALLDQVFAGDTLWQRRRRNLFLVGMVCQADEECFCSACESLPACDLFIDSKRLWLVSSRAGQLYARVGLPLSDAGDRPKLSPGRIGKEAGSLRRRLPSVQSLAALADRCLGCGACAAVCPTCHCFDLRDVVVDEGYVERRRIWDCCQFVDHGLVAGGHNFRPRRADRLHFRLEHKLHGFGALRGTPFCVGCGRCARTCPSGLGVRQVLAAVEGGG